MALGSQIRRYRDKAGITLEKLALLSGVEPGTIAALENRNSSRSSFTNFIARAFGLSAEQLVDESTEYPITLTDVSGAAVQNPIAGSALRQQLAVRLATADRTTVRLVELALMESDEDAVRHLTPSLVAMVRAIKALIADQEQSDP